MRQWDRIVKGISLLGSEYAPGRTRPVKAGGIVVVFGAYVLGEVLLGGL